MNIIHSPIFPRICRKPRVKMKINVIQGPVLHSTWSRTQTSSVTAAAVLVENITLAPIIFSAVIICTYFNNKSINNLTIQIYRTTMTQYLLKLRGIRA